MESNKGTKEDNVKNSLETKGPQQILKNANGEVISLECLADALSVGKVDERSARRIDTTSHFWLFFLGAVHGLF
jgi:hypothetical protein